MSDNMTDPSYPRRPDELVRVRQSVEEWIRRARDAVLTFRREGGSFWKDSATYLKEKEKRGAADVEKAPANLILDRTRLQVLDVQIACPRDKNRQQAIQEQLDHQFSKELGRSVFRDEMQLTLYGAIGADKARAQKRVMIKFETGPPAEITEFSDATVASKLTRDFLRYYFLDDEDFDAAKHTVSRVQRQSLSATIEP